MLEQRVLEFFQRECPLRSDDGLLVAVSGGPDSIALLYMLLAVRDTLGIRLEVAHIDHGMRGQEGVADAAFVAELAEKEGLTLHGRTVDIPALHEEEGGSMEALARRERYRFLEEARAVGGSRWIVTGHNADDQVETFLLNLIRGAGPRGLGGMLPTGPGPRCRPLLSTWRTEILDYLEELGLPHRVDPTNRDLVWTRNRVRHRLVPLLVKEFGPSVLQVLARESKLMKTVDAYLSTEAERILREMTAEAEAGKDVRIPIPRLREYPTVIRQSILRAGLEELAGGLEGISLAHIDAVDGLTGQENGSAAVDLPCGLTARREYDRLVLSADSQVLSPQASPPLDLNRPGEVRWGRLLLRWRPTPSGDVDPGWLPAANQACFDLAEPVPPVYLRSVQPGDRLEPDGMEGTQKLSDLLINRKVPRHLRVWVPVLCDNGGPEDGERILWVVGQRRSRHGPLHSETSQVVLFQAETIV